MLGEDPAYEHRLSTLSEARIGITRGLPRILEILDTHDIKATFYVPGYTAELDSDAIKEIADHGHEIAHHGYMHEKINQLTREEERSVFLRALDGIVKATGRPPRGFRAPSGAFSRHTLELPDGLLVKQLALRKEHVANCCRNPLPDLLG